MDQASSSFEHELEDDISEARRFISFREGKVPLSEDANDDGDENDEDET